MREKWISLYDFNYVDKEIIGGLMDTKHKYSDVIKIIHDKATCGFASKENEEEKSGEKGAESGAKEGESQSKPTNLGKDSKSPRKLNKKITIPEPFNLSVNKPKILQEPIAISNHPKFTSLPLPN